LGDWVEEAAGLRRFRHATIRTQSCRRRSREGLSACSRWLENGHSRLKDAGGVGILEEDRHVGVFDGAVRVNARM
jgi:hypothetical protein